MEGVTNYRGIPGIYFRYLLREIISIGKLKDPANLILDFGCGAGELKSLIGSKQVIGYDIVESLSDIQDWRLVKFNILVANQVFYCFTQDELRNFLMELKTHNLSINLIIGISRQGIINNIGKYIFGRKNAHSRTKMLPKQELSILLEWCSIIRQTSVWGLADIYVMKFKC